MCVAVMQVGWRNQVLLIERKSSEGGLGEVVVRAR
jgi:hypothetical protein